MVTGRRPLLRRGTTVLRGDPRRVIFKVFLPGQEVLIDGISRADAVVQRVLAMSEDDVEATLAATVAGVTEASRDVHAVFAEHFALLAHRMPGADRMSAQRRELVGAYFTQTYAVEAAALFNPCLVLHPDQSGLDSGELRFVMSLRGVGEGHISSIEFRTGVLGAGDEVRFDDPGRHLVVGRAEATAMSREFLRAALTERGDDAAAEHVLSLLPETFTTGDLHAALAANARDRLTRSSEEPASERIRWIAACSYRLTFPADHALPERVVYPSGPDEGRGVEDARFTRFVADDGTVSYYGTYTAFDGSHVAPHLLTTDDFAEFESTRLVGAAAKNKGMALFPRRVGGRYLALSRWDRESIAIASSDDPRRWDDAVTVKTPEQPWELIQLGNCGPPIETDDGWLVLTHGVGPVREYAIGAMLLDLEDPTVVVGALRQPLLTPVGDERAGYVPNVVYSCGALLHGPTLVLPYGCSDSTVRIAFVDVAALLRELRPGPR